MIIRELVEYIVFPKYFNILSFYSKGQYSIRIHLTIEDEKGQITKAYPVLIEGKDARKEEAKKASVKLQPNQVYFETEHFFVTFSEEKIIFNTICLFKVQYQVNKKYKTYLDFELTYLNLKKKKENAPAEDNNIKPTTCIADKRRIYINQHRYLNTFQRIIFEDTDYFSYSDVGIIAMGFGEKIRMHKYCLNDFQLMNIKQREQMNKKKQILQYSQQFDKKSLLYNLYDTSVEHFYQKQIIEKHEAYKKLVHIYEKYRLECINLISFSNSMTQMIKMDEYCWFSHKNAVTSQFLFDLYESDELQDVCFMIYEESHSIIRNSKYVWKKLIKLLIAINFNIVEAMATREVLHQKEIKSKKLYSFNPIQQKDRTDQRILFLEKRISFLKHISVYEDSDLHHPFITLENYQTPKMIDKKQNTCYDSLVVFVHGYQGSDLDMEKAQNFLGLYNGNCYGLLIKSIQDNMDESIQRLGEMVGEEVKMHLLTSENNYQHISFVGYSLGGIIARSSLKHLENYKSKMNIFITFASPHAGIRDNSNYLVRTGVWFLTNFEEKKNLRQLNLLPIDQSTDTTLLKLSQCDCLTWFNRFIVASSKEDDFVPYDSSRIDDSDSTGDQTKLICRNIMKKIKSLERVEVWFDIDHDVGTFEKIIGRKSHIEFLQNRMFLDTFFYLYGPHF